MSEILIPQTVIEVTAEVQQDALDALLADKPEGAIIGYGSLVLTDEDGNVKQVEPFANLITDVGDAYHSRAIAFLANASLAGGNATAITGMQIGTGATAAAKNGAGAAIGTFSAGVLLTAGYPTTNLVSAGNGYNTTYICTFGAGVGTAALTEAALVNVASGSIGTVAAAANTIARIAFSAINKGASDSLTLTWNTLFKGA